MPSVFLSHSSKDKAFARKLASRLTAQEIVVWLDEAEMNIGDSLLMRISSAIEATDFIAVILSHNSINSHWVQTELRMAMNRELADQKVRVLPILIEPCEIPIFLRDKLYADFTDTKSFNAPFAQVLRALGIEKSLDEIEKQPKELPPAGEKVRPTEENLEDFVDIQIIDVDKGRTYNPDPERALYNVYFKLSARPTQEWADIFEAERRFPRHTMWRQAWVDGLYIIVHCVPDEVKKYHLHDIQEDVATSNKKYREQLQREAARKARTAEVEAQKRNALDDALSDLEI